MLFSPGFNPPPLALSPFVFTIHDLIQIQMPGATVAKRLYYRSILKPACARAARVLTVSEYSRRAIIAWSGVPDERIINVGNGVGAPFEPGGPRYDPGFPYILHVGNSRPHKNVRRLLAAFSRLNRAELRLVMVGYRGVEISPAIESAGLGNRAICLDAIDDHQLARIYRGAEAVALPSLLEGFGLPVLESMACGTPVVASKTGALPEVAGDAAVFIDPMDVDDIRSGLDRVLRDGQLRCSLRALGTERARRFSWDAVASKVRSALEEAAEHVQRRTDSSGQSLPPASY